MTGWLARLALAWGVVGLSAGLGHWMGGVFGLPTLGLLLGGAAGLTAWWLAAEWHVARLLRWLHTASDQAVPRACGRWGDLWGDLWAELAYRIEQALRQRDRDLAAEQARLTEFLSGIEASPNGVLLLNADDQITWCNRLAADHLGLDALRDLRQAITNLVRSPEFVAHLKARDWSEPVNFTAPGGAASLSVLISRYGDGQKLVLSQDVTERLRLETMRRDFVANVSHEIRTPLTVLSGFVETMAKLPLSDAERAPMLALMQAQAQRMQVLVADLLTLSQLEGSPRPAVDRWVAVDVLMQRAVADARSLSAGQHEVRLSLPIEAATAGGQALAGSEAELHSALGNLLSNAVRYTPKGGHINAAWRLLADGSGELTVRDNGIGIAREHLPRLTERFYRVDGSRSRETGGTGLGLAIVKHVMQRHGGSVQVDSEPGRGSCFKLLFPPGRVRQAG